MPAFAEVSPAADDRHGSALVLQGRQASWHDFEPVRHYVPIELQDRQVVVKGPRVVVPRAIDPVHQGDLPGFFRHGRVAAEVVNPSSDYDCLESVGGVEVNRSSSESWIS